MNLNYRGQKSITQEDLVDEKGNQIILKDRLQNLFYFSNEFNVTGYVSPQKYFTKDKHTHEYTVNQNKAEVFSVTGLTYDYEDQNDLTFNISIPISEKFIDKNSTLYLHVEYEADYRFKDEHMGLDMPKYQAIQGYSDAWFKNNGNTIVMHRTVPLVKFSPKTEEKKTVNLLSGEIEEEKLTEIEDEEEEEEEENKEQKELIQHMKPEIYCYMSPDTTIYPRKSIPEQFKNILFINTQLSYYEPIFVCTDFWIYKELLVELNKTVSTANVTVHLQPYSIMKIAIMEQMVQVNGLYAEWGMAQDMDLTKKMFSETNFYLLVLTMVVSLAHTVCEVMAFKNEIHFWKNRDSLKGISVRTLFINL